MDVKSHIDREELLKIVQENKKQHAGMYQEALEGYCDKAAKGAAAIIEKLRKGEAVSVSLSMQPPVDHTRDYDRVIKMLGLSKQLTIELAEYDFANLVEDDWDWTERWVTSNSCFSEQVTSYGLQKKLKVR